MIKRVYTYIWFEGTYLGEEWTRNADKSISIKQLGTLDNYADMCGENLSATVGMDRDSTLSKVTFRPR